MSSEQGTQFIYVSIDDSIWSMEKDAVHAEE